MSQKFSEALRDEIAPLWLGMLNTRVYRALMSDDPVGKELLAIYLIESYHYAKHNAQHQAMAVWRSDVNDREFMRAALQHAIEEVDHDQLALRDLERMGYLRAAVERSVPLPETQGFTGFLYHWVTRENPIGRLGYSLWAEGTQEIGPGIIERLKSKFGIKDNKEITFFTAHAVLDMRHGQEARDNIDRFARTEDDRQAVRTVATTTLKLFTGVLEAMYDHYEDVKQGASVVRIPRPA